MVAGGGIFGVTAALELARRGWQVTLADPGPLPRAEASSTDRSKVIRMDYGRDDALSRLAQQAMEGWDEWNRQRFSRPLFHRTGFLLLRGSALEPGSFESASIDSLQGRGIPVERLDGAAIRRRFPAWNAERYPDGYLSPTAGWAESGEVVRQLVGWARKAGVRVLEGQVAGVVRGEVSGAQGQEGVPPGEGPVTGARLVDGRVLPCSVLVVAAGAWTPALLAGPAFEGIPAPDLRASAMPVLYLAPGDPRPFRGAGFPVWSADISRTGWYGFPAGPDGIVKIGHHGTGEARPPEAGVHPGPDWEARCRAFLRESLPGLAEAPLAGSRTCWYCDSVDGDFWITRHPACPGLVLATGGSGHGFKFAPVLGTLVANAVEGVPDPRLARFRWRDPDGARREHARCEEGVSPG